MHVYIQFFVSVHLRIFHFGSDYITCVHIGRVNNLLLVIWGSIFRFSGKKIRAFFDLFAGGRGGFWEIVS